MCPWFDAECRTICHHCRHLERRYRRTRDPADEATYIAATRDKHTMYDEKKNTYWSGRITTDGRSPTKLWRSLNTLLQRDKRTQPMTSHRQATTLMLSCASLTTKWKPFVHQPKISHCPHQCQLLTHRCRYCHRALRRKCVGSSCSHLRSRAH